MIGCPKPKPRSRTKTRRDEQAVIASVRAAVVERDYRRGCRAAHLGRCEGMLEWAHLHHVSRAKTRGMAPEVRHTTAGTLLLCAGHHQDYDEHRLTIDGTTLGADGPLVIQKVSGKSLAAVSES